MMPWSLSAPTRTAKPDAVRFAAIAATGILLIFAALEASIVIPPAIGHPAFGMDFGIYMDRTRAWLAGDGFYLPAQLSGPYDITTGTPPALYPPTLLYLLVQFTILPAVLWWLVPLGIIGLSLYRLRPPVWTWPILAAILCYPRTWLILVYGNPSLWAFAMLTAGLAWTWPLAFVALKPTLGPFALVGIRRRRFWVGVAAFGLLALPFGAMWLGYLSALANARGGSLEYLAGELPIGLALLSAGVGVRPDTAADAA